MFTTKIILFLPLFFISCKSDSTYIEKNLTGYSFDEKEEAPVNINAANDIEPYLAAYRNFAISKRVSMDSSEAVRFTSSIPISIEVLNNKWENISNKIDLKSTDSIERYFDKAIECRKTNIQEPVQSAEDKNKISVAEDCPIKVLSAQPVYRETSNFKDLRLVWKNISKKTILKIKFKWTGLNAFGEPADMGGYMGTLLPGEGNGISDNRLLSGKSLSGQWSILSKDLEKVTNAWAYEVVFKDGSKWNSNE